MRQHGVRDGEHRHTFPTYREHGVAWCRDVGPVTLLGLYRGVNLGGGDPAEHNFHLYTIVIGTQTLHATGYAMGVQRDGAVGTGDPRRDTAVIAYFGDGRPHREMSTSRSCSPA